MLQQTPGKTTAGPAAQRLGTSRPGPGALLRKVAAYPLCSNQSPENTTFKGSGPWRKERRPPPPPRPEVRFSPEGAPLPRTRTQLLSNVGAEALQPEPSNSRAAAFSTNQRRPRLTRLTNQRRRRKEVSRAFEEGPLNSNSSAR